MANVESIRSNVVTELVTAVFAKATPSAAKGTFAMVANAKNKAAPWILNVPQIVNAAMANVSPKNAHVMPIVAKATAVAKADNARLENAKARTAADMAGCADMPMAVSDDACHKIVNAMLHPS